MASLLLQVCEISLIEINLEASGGGWAIDNIAKPLF
jgi:hypothetical protein